MRCYYCYFIIRSSRNSTQTRFSPVRPDAEVLWLPTREDHLRQLVSAQQDLGTGPGAWGGQWEDLVAPPWAPCFGGKGQRNSLHFAQWLQYLSLIHWYKIRILNKKWRERDRINSCPLGRGYIVNVLCFILLIRYEVSVTEGQGAVKNIFGLWSSSEYSRNTALSEIQHFRSSIQ